MVLHCIALQTQGLAMFVRGVRRTRTIACHCPTMVCLAELLSPLETAGDSIVPCLGFCNGIALHRIANARLSNVCTWGSTHSYHSMPLPYHGMPSRAAKPIGNSRGQYSPLPRVLQWYCIASHCKRK